MIARCRDCGCAFEKQVREHWKVRCLACWALAKGVSGAITTTATDGVTDELRDRLKALVSLCHPDRHGGSRLATNTTQWLLAVRDRLGGAR